MAGLLTKGVVVGFSFVGTCVGVGVLIRNSIGGDPYDDAMDHKMLGKTIIVTGANSGIGFETAREMARRGGRVVMACRDMKKCEVAKAKIREIVHNRNIECQELDLASMASIRKFAADIQESEKHVDVLINNAGIMRCPKQLTQDGFEMQLGVNHFGHFLLTNLLLDKLKESAPSRVINVTSVSHKDGVMKFDDLNSAKSYDRGVAYDQSKLANLLFNTELAKRLEGTGVTANAVYPGLSITDLERYTGYGQSKFSRGVSSPIVSPFKKTAQQGAQTSVYVAVEPSLEKVNGKYFSNCREAKPSPKALDEKDARRLWLISEKWTELT